MSGERGKYVVLEGNDGTGKSSVADLLAGIATSEGETVYRWDEPDSIKDPDGNVLVDSSALLRRVMKGMDHDYNLSPEGNLLGMTLSRHESWPIAKAALKMGAWVVSARNHRSSDVFQGFGEGLDLSLIRTTTKLFMDDEYLNPDHEFILDLSDDPEERLRRIAARGILEVPDEFEKRDEEFQQRLEEGYLHISKEFGIPVVSAKPPKDVIARSLWDHIQQAKPIA